MNSITRLTALVASGLLATSLCPSGVRAQTTADLTVIRVASAPTDQITPVLYAVNAGLFKKAGLDVQVSAMRSGAEIAAALIGGSLDIGAAQIVLPILAHSRGVPITLVAPTLYYDSAKPDSGVLVAATSPIRSPKELTGKTIGISAAQDVFALSVMAWLDQNGVDPLNAARFLEISVPTVPAALQQGRIDAGFAYEPILSNAVASGGSRILGYPLDAFGRRSEPSGYFATTAWVSAHHDELARFNRVLFASEQYVSAHEDEAAPLFAAFSGIPADVVARLPHSGRALYLVPDQIQPYINAAVKYKFIPAGFPAQDLISAYALKPSR